MCGIAGVFKLNGGSIDPSQLEIMALAIQHRGPDDDGLYLNDSIGLAHRRLSIIDLSEAGHQPMSSADGRYWIVYNGEIYNYIELKQDLKEKGFIFQTETDTEVILAAYQLYGADCVNQFNGMWAFAIWDEKRKQLFCSRDRFGIKPFYYSILNGCFYFASELKAICAIKELDLNISNESVFLYLNHNFANYQDKTFIREIFQLEPAHSLAIDRENKRVWRYWDLATVQDIALSYSDPVDEFRFLFADSIRLRMRSDVPIGTCLSGGLDSSSIVCMTNQLLSKEKKSSLYKQETFSACFEENNIDERPFMEFVLNNTGANRNFVFPDENSLMEDLEKLIYYQDEPFVSLSIFAQWMVMKTAKNKGITVLLDGQGADEVLAGYGFHSFFWADLLREMNWSRLYGEVAPEIFSAPLQTMRRFGRMFFPRLIHNWESRTLMRPYLNKEFLQIYSQKRAENYKYSYPKILKNELYNLLDSSLSQLLRYEDRNSMAFSLEARVPFLDYRLVQFVFSLPEFYLIQKGWSKWILRQSMESILPSEIQWRKTKIGFVVPQQTWLRQTLQPFVREILNDSRFQQRHYWNGKRVLEAYEQWVSGKSDDISQMIWKIINLELWLRRFIDS